jgi:molybdopterin molybdotransferase
MIPYREALDRVRESAGRRRADTGIEETPLEAAVGQVLARELRAPREVPAFANSAMDGFAVRTAAFGPDPAPVLAIAGEVAAGDRPPHAGGIGDGASAWEIMTGAPVPEPCDAVIRVEETERVSPGRVRLKRLPSPGENVRPAGEDFHPGDRLLAAGVRITPEHVLVLASLGLARIPVWRRPRIAVISTGPELVELAAEAGDLPVGRIYNSTAPYLRARLGAFGAEVSYFGVVPDDPAHFHTLLGTILRSDPDLVVTTGAVSMGKHDFILPALADAGAQVIFHRVAIRPGKPIAMAEWADRPTVFFGLPGNPISTAVGCRFFVEPWLRAKLGRSPERPRQATLAEPFAKPEGLQCFLKAAIDSDTRRAWVLPGQASSLVGPLLRAQAWLVAPEGPAPQVGEAVTLFPLEGGEG